VLAAATPQVCGGFCDDEAAEVYVLADGHGGHEVAEYVACHAAPTLAECLLALAPARARAAAAAGGGVAYEAATVQQAMRAAFHRLNTFIPPGAASGPSVTGGDGKLAELARSCGCTVVVAMVQGPARATPSVGEGGGGVRLHVANVGDTRAVLCRRGRSADVTVTPLNGRPAGSGAASADADVVGRPPSTRRQGHTAATGVRLTTDHKADAWEERARVEAAGGCGEHSDCPARLAATLSWLTATHAQLDRSANVLCLSARVQKRRGARGWNVGRLPRSRGPRTRAPRELRAGDPLGGSERGG
jgi:hypothetical protein